MKTQTLRSEVRPRDTPGPESRLHQIGADFGCPPFRRDPGGRLPLQQPLRSLIDRAAFLVQTARPVTISDLEARDVNVRLMGDVAIIHARTTYVRAERGAGSGRYTDVWARREGRWLAVSAHVTRC